jgi:nucleoside-diphosphate-sugar epimerase
MEKLGKMKILLTGATGFIGSNILRKLVKANNDKIYIFIRQNSNLWRIKDITNKINTRIVDLTDKEQVENSISEIKPEVVFHCAIYGGYPFQTDLDQVIRTNFIGTVNLLEASIKQDFKVFINTGSSSEYGIKSQPMKETDFPDPINVYGVAKLASTYYCRMTSIKYNLPIVTLRLFSPYGYYEEPTRLIPYLITSMLRNREIKLGSPDAVRDFVFIEDAVEAYFKLVNMIDRVEPGTILNIGSGVDSKVINIFNTLKELTDYKFEPIIEGIPRDSDQLKVWRANIDQATAVLGWKPVHSLKEGLIKTVEWLKNNMNYYEEVI